MVGMQAAVQLATLVFGFIFGFILYEKTKYRVGGVVAIPVIITYSIDDPLLLPIFLISIVVCYVAGAFVAKQTLIFGRRLLYIFMIISVFVTSGIIFFMGEFYSSQILLITVGSIFPGILAYNLHREIFDRSSAIDSIAILGLNLIIVGIFALIMILFFG
jgi:hypothetical protein